jgi:RNA-directed DNA polymerase
MIKAPIKLQDLRRKIYIKAKAQPRCRFWGLYVHVCKEETLREAYRLAKKNNGAPGIDGVTFEAIEAEGVGKFLAGIRGDLLRRTYRPTRVRRVEIPKGKGKTRVLSIPTIRDRVVQGALKLILEPIFEADFQPGSFGYRPKKSAHDALCRVQAAILEKKNHVLDLDLRAYFDNVRHHILFEKVAKRVDDADVMRLLKLVVKATGKRGVPQGGVISPLLSNIYLNEVDKMLEKAKTVTRYKRWTELEYVRFADDLVVLITTHPRQSWLRKAVHQRLREEFAKVGVEINEEKTKVVNLESEGSFGFLGFQFRGVLSWNKKWMPLLLPEVGKRTLLLRRLKEIFRGLRSQPVDRVIQRINPILRGWVGYFAVGHSSKCFSFIRDWVEKKIRRHLARASKRGGFGWKRWSRAWLYGTLGLYDDYRLKWRAAFPKAAPARSAP